MIAKALLDEMEERLSSTDPARGAPTRPLRVIVREEAEVVARLTAVLRDLGYDHLPAALDAAVLRSSR